MNREAIVVGERVRDGLGHWYDVVEVGAGGGVLRLQPLTWIGSPAKLVPFGTPVHGFRSDFRKDGE